MKPTQSEARTKWHFYFMWAFAVWVNLIAGVVLVLLKDYTGILWIVASGVWWYTFNKSKGELK